MKTEQIDKAETDRPQGAACLFGVVRGCGHGVHFSRNIGEINRKVITFYLTMYYNRQ